MYILNADLESLGATEVKLSAESSSMVLGCCIPLAVILRFPLATRSRGTPRVFVRSILRTSGSQRVFGLRTMFLELIMDPFTGTEVREAVDGVNLAAKQTCRGSEVRRGRKTMSGIY